MPLKGVNIGPGSTPTTANHDHWWFKQWEPKGVHNCVLCRTDYYSLQ